MNILIADYNPIWPKQFARLKAELLAALGGLVIAIEHVGSTSVPGLAAKPIIDIDIVIQTSAELPAAIERLASIGYQHQGDLGIAGRQAFKSPSDQPQRHVYVCTQNSVPLREHLAFCDYLRSHPVVASEYAALKRRLAMSCGEDRTAYTEGKSAFVRDVLNQATV